MKQKKQKKTHVEKLFQEDYKTALHAFLLATLL